MVKITITIGDKTYSGDVNESTPANAGYESTDGSQETNEQTNNQEGGKRMKKEKKAKGTRKLSPYMKFAQEARPKVLKEHPEMKSDIIGVGRKIGEMWRALSDSEKAKY
jgi:hypothetical protein